MALPLLPHRCPQVLLRSPARGKGAISTLVLSPTRELASQICKEAEMLSCFHAKLTTNVIFGGVPIKKDYAKFGAGVDILVATPGRLIDHLDNTDGFAAKLAHISFLIFDEADQMLDMGFRPGERTRQSLNKTRARSARK